MSGPVDVLANLASMAAAHGEKWEQIHDAVSELIEAAREMYELADAPSEGRFCTNAAAFLKADERCRAALARVGAA